MLSVYLIVGAFAGVMSGLFGVGGGVIVIPALAAIFLHNTFIPTEYEMQMAVGTSLAIMLATATSALYAHHKRKAVRWEIFKTMLPGLVLGAIVGAVIDHFLPSRALQIFFGIFLFIIGLRMTLNKRVKAGVEGLSISMMRLGSILIGALSSLLGVGGGALLLPFFLRCQLDMQEAAGTSIACGLSVGVVATLSFMVTGWFSMVHVPMSTGYIYWPAFFGIALTSTMFAPLGALMAHKLPKEFLKRFFGVFLLLMAFDMLFLK